MFKTIKKALFFSLFAYSLIFPMRQIVQSALVNAVSKSQIVQLVSARMLHQSRSFSNSPIARCPTSFLQMTMEAINSEAMMVTQEAVETTNLVADTSNQEITASISTDSQSVTNNNQTSSDLKTGQTINQNIPSWYIDLRQDPQLAHWQPTSSADKIQAYLDYNTTQAAQHLSEILDRGQAEYQREVYITNIKSHISSTIENFAIKVENEKNKRVSSYVSLSHNELLAEKNSQTQNLYELEMQFRDLCQESDIASNVSRIKRNESYHQSYEIPRELTYSKDRCTIKELQQYDKALDLKVKIEATELAIQESNWMIGRPERESRDFVAKVEVASVDELEKIRQELIAKKDALTTSFIEKNNERIYKNNELKAIETQINLLNSTL